jgi:hypothetical protein
MDGGGSGFCCGKPVSMVAAGYFIRLTSEPSFSLLSCTEAVEEGIGITGDLNMKG